MYGLLEGIGRYGIVPEEPMFHTLPVLASFVSSFLYCACFCGQGYVN